MVCLGQTYTLNDYIPYILKSRNLTLNLPDTTIAASVITDTIGNYYIRDGYDYVDSEGKYRIQTDNTVRIFGKKKEDVLFKDSLIKSQSPELNIDSYFPKLIQDSSKVIIDSSSFLEKWMPHFGYELNYSYILNGANEPYLYKSDKDSTFRFITKINFYRSDRPKKGDRYNIYTVDLSGEKVFIRYKQIEHQGDEKFIITKNRENYVLDEKLISAFHSEINKYDLSDTAYFIKYDNNFHFILEFKTKDKYVALSRPYMKVSGSEYDGIIWVVESMEYKAFLDNRKQIKKPMKNKN